MNSHFYGVPAAAILVLALSACSAFPSASESKQDKRIADTNIQLGIAYMRQGDYDTAMTKLQKALEADPNSATANGTLAILYESIGENDLAEKHFNKALRLSPEDPQTHNNYGQFLCRHGKYTQALEQFKIAASDPLYPGIAASLTNAGICAGKIPDPAQAEGFFRKALERDQNFAYALLQMANLMYTQGNYLAARAYIQRFDSVSAPGAESLWLGVRIETALGDSSAAGGYALKLKNNFPKSTEAESLRQWENEHRGQQ
jgi:type IV pilus assembly protein PilF